VTEYRIKLMLQCKTKLIHLLSKECSTNATVSKKYSNERDKTYVNSE